MVMAIVAIRNSMNHIFIYLFQKRYAPGSAGVGSFSLSKMFEPMNMHHNVNINVAVARLCHGSILQYTHKMFIIGDTMYVTTKKVFMALVAFLSSVLFLVITPNIYSVVMAPTR